MSKNLSKARKAELKKEAIETVEEQRKMTPAEREAYYIEEGQRIKEQDEKDTDESGELLAMFEISKGARNPDYDAEHISKEALHHYTPEQIQEAIEQSRANARSDSATSASAMDVSHADEEYELFQEFQDGDEEEPQGKEAGRGGKKSKRRSKNNSKKNSRKKSKKITKKSMKKRRKPVRKSKRRRGQYGGLKSDGLSAKLSALRTAVTAGGSAVHTELLRQLILKETDEEVANTLRESISNPVLVHSPPAPGSLDRYRLSFRAIEKHLFEDRAIEFSPALGRYILSGEFVVPDGLPGAYFCPISLEMMTDPVITESGNTYERAYIANWYLGHSTNPLTGEPLPLTPDGQPKKQLIPNIALMNAINYETGRDLYAPPPPPPPP